MARISKHIKRKYVTVNIGDEVKIIADHGNVQIVENANGIRFAVKKEDLTDIDVGDIPVVEEKPVIEEKVFHPDPEPVKKKSRTKKEQPKTQTLF